MNPDESTRRTLVQVVGFQSHTQKILTSLEGDAPKCRAKVGKRAEARVERMLTIFSELLFGLLMVLEPPCCCLHRPIVTTGSKCAVVIKKVVECHWQKVSTADLLRICSSD